MYLIGNGKLITRSKTVPDQSNGAVLVDGDKIAAVGNFDTLKANNPDAELIDAHGGVIMPGFVNAHIHSRRLVLNNNDLIRSGDSELLQYFRNQLWKRDRDLTLSDCTLGAYAAAVCCIKNGITAVFEHHSSPDSASGSLISIASAFREAGIRASVCYSVGEHYGAREFENALTESLEFYDYCAELDTSMLKPMFGLYAPMTLGSDALARCIVKNNGRMGFHIHASFLPDDVYDSINRYGIRPIERLHREGALGESALIAGCSYANDGELDLLHATGSHIVIAPFIQLSFGLKPTDVSRMLKAGLKPCVGTDAAHIGFIENLRLASAIGAREDSFNIEIKDLLAAVYDASAKLASDCFGINTGRLEAGAAADIVILRSGVTDPVYGDNDYESAVLASDGIFEMTMVNGRILMRDGIVTSVDIDRLKYELKRMAFARNDR